jgi:aminomethyltransferase
MKEPNHIRELEAREMFQRIGPMATIRDQGAVIRAAVPGLRNPLDQDQAVWQVVSTESLRNSHGHAFTRTTDETGILDDIAAVVGPPTAMCVLGNNVIGAASWERVSFADQYRAVTAGAGAFVASNMLYLRVRGPDAAAVLDALTPRNMASLAVGRATFTLFTTPQGTVDEEAMVLRTADEEFLVSCGGGNPPRGLADALAEYPSAEIEEADIVSFNIKGPGGRSAMQALVRSEFHSEIASLQPFRTLDARTPAGDAVRILKTIVGIEMWGTPIVIRQAWNRMLAMPGRVTPCAWDVLNVYRMECNAMVFILYPLDVHAGITLWEAGYGWMVHAGADKDYVGRQALTDGQGKERCRLAGLRAVHGDTTVPPVGAEVLNARGELSGFITSAAYSVRYARPLAFAHLVIGQHPGDRLVVGGYGEWSVCHLPFGPA